MMKKLYTLLIALLFVGGTIGQTDDPRETCLPNGITFKTQAQIDDFQTNYPNCTEIEGGVSIGKEDGSDITNLDGLNVITSIGGSLRIGFEDIFPFNNPSLISLSGLSNLTYIGGDLRIYYNNVLTSLMGLEGLTSVGGSLSIGRNEILTSLASMEGLTSIEGNVYIGGFYGNPSLTSLSGLDNVSSIGGDLRISGNYLLDLTGLDNLSSIGGILSIVSNPLTSLSGLDNLTYVGTNIEIISNVNLTSLTGLEGLTSIGGFLAILSNNGLTSLAGLNNVTSIGGSLVIDHNQILTSLEGLENVASIEGYLTIRGNYLLTNISDLGSINVGSIQYLQLYYNLSLSTCDVKSICDYLLIPNVPAEIHDNAAGCNNQQEVVSACTAGLEENQTAINHLDIYPNPTQSSITIELSTQPSINTSLTISNTNGQQLITQPITKPKTEIDLANLPPGIYIVKVWSDKEVMVQKVIKQ